MRSRVTIFLYFITFCLIQSSYAQLPENLHFKRLGTAEGLTELSVTSIAQDQQGFIWVATVNGLFRYDGLNMEKYPTQLGNPYAVSHSYINKVVPSAKGGVWISTDGGLHYYDPNTGTFKHWMHQKDDATSLPFNSVYCIMEDHKGNVWFSIFNKGLGYFDTKTEIFSYWPNGSGLIAKRGYECIMEDKKGNVWFGSTGGDLILYDESTHSFISSQSKFPELSQFSNTKVQSLFEDSQERIWIGTADSVFCFDPNIQKLINYPLPETYQVASIYDFEEGEYGRMWIGTDVGLLALHLPSDTWQKWSHQEGNSWSVSNNMMYDIMIDQQGLIWLTSLQGVNLLDPQSFDFEHIIIPRVEGLPQSNEIHDIALEAGETLWGMTPAGGFRYDMHRKQFRKLPNSFTKAEQTSYTFSITKDSSGDLWFSQEDNLIRYQPKNGQINRWTSTAVTANGRAFESSIWFHIVPSMKGGMWMGSWAKGLVYWNHQKDSIRHWKWQEDGVIAYDSIQLFSPNIRSLAYHPDGNLWLSTPSGLYMLNPHSNEVMRFLHNQDDTTTISDDDFKLSFLVDAKQQIWMGAATGLNLYLPDSKSFKRYGKKQGLPDAKIGAMIADEHHNIWLGTNLGIYKFDPIAEKAYAYVPFNNYLIGGMQRAIKDEKGNLYFSGYKGIVRFHPDSVRNNSFLPKTIISNLLIFNQEVKDSTVLPRSISSMDEIVLTHHQSVFSFEFLALNHRRPSQNRYQYKMKGFNERWVEIDARNPQATFTNLDAGTYTFMVKAANDDGFWNDEPTTIRVIILPPWYLATWAKALWIALSIGSLLGIYFWRVITLKKQKVALEEQVEARTLEIRAQNEEISNQKEEILQQAEALKTNHERLSQLSNFKESMTGMVAHDLKNPLGVILGLSKDRPKINKMADQMLNLIMNMLDVQKFENAAMKVNLEAYLLQELVGHLLERVGLFMNEKRIVFQNNVDERNAVLADKDLLLRVMVNLLTNAIKYTSIGGRITVESRYEGEFILISVIDTGKGIPPHLHESIFNQFEQAEARKTGQIRSTGLGLAFCKMAIEAMGSEIEVISDVNEGATFQFLLPVAASTEFNKEGTAEAINIAVQALSKEESEVFLGIIQQLKDLEVEDAVEIESIIEATPLAVHQWGKHLIQLAYEGESEQYQSMLKEIEGC